MLCQIPLLPTSRPIAVCFHTTYRIVIVRNAIEARSRGRRKVIQPTAGCSPSCSPRTTPRSTSQRGSSRLSERPSADLAERQFEIPPCRQRARPGNRVLVRALGGLMHVALVRHGQHVLDRRLHASGSSHVFSYSPSSGPDRGTRGSRVERPRCVDTAARRARSGATA